MGQGNIFRSMCQEFCPLGGGASSGGVLSPGGGASCRGVLPPRGLPRGGGAGGDTPGTATAAGGTHPTGMHSCLYMFYS